MSFDVLNIGAVCMNIQRSVLVCCFLNSDWTEIRKGVGFGVIRAPIPATVQKCFSGIAVGRQLVGEEESSTNKVYSLGCFSPSLVGATKYTCVAVDTLKWASV